MCIRLWRTPYVTSILIFMNNATSGVEEEDVDLDDLILDESHKRTRKLSVFFIASIILVGTASFGLGRLTKIVGDREPILIELPSNLEAKLPSEAPAILGVTASSLPTAGSYVASKSGTKYHLPWCSGALRIKEENKIWFQTKEEALRAGYTPAANCKGI